MTHGSRTRLSLEHSDDHFPTVEFSVGVEAKSTVVEVSLRAPTSTRGKEGRNKERERERESAKRAVEQ